MAEESVFAKAQAPQLRHQVNITFDTNHMFDYFTLSTGLLKAQRSMQEVKNASFR